VKDTGPLRHDGCRRAQAPGAPPAGTIAGDDVARILAGSRRGMTAHGMAAILRSTSTPAPHHVAAVAEELDALVLLGRARRVDGQRRLGHGGRADTAWYPT
jgi:hypothetical protein